MLIASWNVNSLRARIVNVTRWLEETHPDLLLVQEIKCSQDDFPHLELGAAGYRALVAGQKSYNGVALLSRTGFSETLSALPGDPSGQARYLEATVGGVRVACVYAPNGNPVETEKFSFKMSWMASLKQHIKTLLESEKPFLLGGDFNVIPEEIDVYDPAGWQDNALFRPETRAAWREIVNLGVWDAFRALHPTEKAYSFWDYQGKAWQNDEGLRIDHFLLSPEIVDRMTNCRIDKRPRGWEQPSDHVPVLLEI